MPLSEVTALDDRLLQDIADSLASTHKILLITGAGISTSSGIPDFRSKEGLYNLTFEQNSLPTPPSSVPSTPSKNFKIHTTAEDVDEDEELQSSQVTNASTSSRRSSTNTSSKLRGQDLFDARVLHSAESTTMFYRFIASLRQKIQDDVKDTSVTHKFVRTLRDSGRLMRCYTQNIDGLEAREGLCMDLKRGKGNKRRFMKKNVGAPPPPETRGTDFDRGCEVVQLHGDLDKLRCNVCSAQYLWTEDETEIFLDGFAPRCQKCSTKSDARLANGKRGLAVGSLRPNVILYGEDHPSNSLLAPFVPFDAGSIPEALIIMGTSLKVYGLQQIVREFAKAVHAQKNGKGKVIFVNRTKPAESVWEGIIDYFVSMDCDDWVSDLKQRRADLWVRQGEISASSVKQVPPKRKRTSETNDEVSGQAPAKKPKFVIEIARRDEHTTSIGAENVGAVKPVKVNPAGSRRRKKPPAVDTPILTDLKIATERLGMKISKTAHQGFVGITTPRKVRPTFTPVRRPTPSPLINSFKPRVAVGAGVMSVIVPGSPRTPFYSPITPKVFKDSPSRKVILPIISETNEAPVMHDKACEREDVHENTPIWKHRPIGTVLHENVAALHSTTPTKNSKYWTSSRFDASDKENVLHEESEGPPFRLPKLNFHSQMSSLFNSRGDGQWTTRIETEKEKTELFRPGMKIGSLLE